MPQDVLKRYNDFLVSLSDDLDISPSAYLKIVKSYEAVGEWLNSGEYEGSLDGVAVYPQGSAALGTLTKPFKRLKKKGYDIDLVCELSVPKSSTTPDKVKRAVGERLKDKEVYNRMLDEEGKRCWTLEYAEDEAGNEFHLDVLPSVRESRERIELLSNHTDHMELVETSIAITNKNIDGTYKWDTSNPLGYYKWFSNINNTMLQAISANTRQKLYENNKTLFASVDAVPDQLIRTPLQRAIQIMKRHRDIRFSGQDFEEYKPISMIITTLAARLYGNEADVFSALQNIIEKLHLYSTLVEGKSPFIDDPLIERGSDGKWYIGNPVNKLENFADKWDEDNEARARAFFEWVSWLYTDLIQVTQSKDVDTILESVKGRFNVKPENTESQISMPSIITARKKPYVEIENPSKPWCNTTTPCVIKLKDILKK